MNEIIRSQPQSLSTYLDLPPAPNEDRYDLTSELRLMRSTLAVAAEANHNTGAARLLSEIASVEKANLKLATLSDRILSKTTLRQLADRMVSVLAKIVQTEPDEQLRAALYHVITAARNLPADYHYD